MHNGIRRALTFAVLSAIFAATTACGPAGSPTSKTQPSTSAQQPLTEAELTEALPDGVELPGFAATPQDLVLLEAEDVVTADKAACRPIADMMSVRPRHPRKAMVWATLKPYGAPADATPSSLTLSSHEDKAAQAWMAELKQALAGCAEFTAVSQRGWTHRFRVRPLSSVKAGDDSVSYVVTNALAPDGKGNVMTVVRTGGVFATYLMNQDTGKPVPVPVAIANQQHKKLQGAANS